MVPVAAMQDADELIRSLLGADAVDFYYELNRVTRLCYHSAVPLPVDDACSLALKFLHVFDNADIRLFVGDMELDGIVLPRDLPNNESAYPLVALPGLPTLDIPLIVQLEGSTTTTEQLFQMGALSPGQYEQMKRLEESAPFEYREDTASIRAMLAAVYSRHPFLIYFADPKGLHATFRDRISVEDAMKVVESILTVDFDAMSVMQVESPEEMAEWISRHGGFTLWYD